MQNRFRAFGISELPNMEFRATADEAIQLAVERMIETKTQETILVEQVRDPQLSDFCDPTQFVSLLRERMTEVIGNDDGLSDPETVGRVINEIIDKVHPVLDQLAFDTAVRIDGFVTINSERYENWWTKQ